jgi:dephospho-CoA kinase
VAPVDALAYRPDPMKVVGLTGGIGAGKSTVSAALAERGALIIDADLIAREIVRPDGLAYAALVEHFGEGVLRPDGTLDRAALAAVVFSDPVELAALNAITHPAINAVIAQRLGAADADRVVVVDAALRFDAAEAPMVGRLLVDVDPEIAVERLVRFRGFSEQDARNRIASQVSRAERLAAADHVIDNSGSLEALDPQIDAVWSWIEGLPASPTRPA